MTIEFRGLTVEVHPKGQIKHSADLRAHTLIRNMKDNRVFVDVVPFQFGPYITPWGFEMLAWVLVPKDKEVERNYDLEEYSITSVLTRYMVAITESEFERLLEGIQQPETQT